jgi:Domain of unknown function (DUF6048)
MKRISVYFTSLLLLITFSYAAGQDTVPVPKTIKLGADIYGPLYHLYDKNNLTIEGFLSVDIDTGKAVVLEGGYLNYEYSQYNYDYLNHGIFFRAGMDFNLLKPQTSLGKYYAGIGLRYGISFFNSSTPFLKTTNYWGTATGSISAADHIAHFLEASPGIRTELFRNFEIGWTIRLRFLVYSNTGKTLKAIYIPGFGNSTKSFSPGINYYLMWSIPYKR